MRRVTFVPLSMFGLLAILAPAPRVEADLPPLIPREVLYGNPDRAGPQLSPDGTQIGYLRADDRGVMQVWVRTVGKDDDRPITSDKSRGIRNWSWPYDGKHLLYSQDSGGDENNHLFAVDLATRETRDMTPILGVKANLEAAEPTKPGEVLVSLNRRTRSLFDLWRLDLESGALTMVAENPGNAVELVADRDLQLRGIITVRPQGGQELMVPAEGGGWRSLFSWSGEERFDPMGFAKDGKTLYALSNVGADTLGLLQVDIATGERKPIASDPTADAGGGIVHPESGVPQAISFSRDRVRWKVLDPSIADDLEALSKVEDGDLLVTSRDVADKVWTVAFSSDRRPTRWYLWRRDEKRAEFLFSAKKDLEALTLASMTFVDVPARDGLMLPSYLTLPAGVEAKNLPLVLVVHGGPWARDRWGFNPQVQHLANRGYAVLQVNYRGSTGFGKKHTLAAKREFAGKMHDDLIDGVNWAVKEGYADPKRVGILGGSYGGYATLVGLAFTPDVFACGVDVVGPSNLVSLVESFPPYWGPDLVNTWYPYVGNPKDPKDRADMEKRSPLFRVDKIRAPLLVGQGANDPRVTRKESDQMVEALKKRGLEVEYIVFDDEGHGFARPENRLKFAAATETFLAKHLGGRAEP